MSVCQSLSLHTARHDILTRSCKVDPSHVSNLPKIVTLQALPFNIETPSQKAYKTSLERRMQEVEEATKVFSRTKVLVEM